MRRKSILVGNADLNIEQRRVTGGYVDLQGESFYKISNYDHMPPFFMSIVSSSDHWMFISSNGGLTAGRKNPDNALFPYYTDDRIHDSKEQTGSKTILFVTGGKKTYLWEPFSQAYSGIYRIKRNLYKNIYGNKLIFEEINPDIGVTFRYAWFNSEQYGFIRRSQILNHTRGSIKVNILDGIQNLLPSGLNRRFQLEYSTLVDGYKKNELQVDSGLGLFMLSSIPIDRAEPSEALKATAVWSAGIKNSKKLVSSLQMDAFKKGFPVKQETDIRASRGAYFITAEFPLAKEEEKEWFIVADVNQDASAVAALSELIKAGKNVPQQLMDDVAASTDNLVKIVGGADGLQKTEDTLVCSRHFSNTLFNVMRGGLFDTRYFVERDDFISFVQSTNKPLAETFHSFLQALPEKIVHADLLSTILTLHSVDLEKLCYEYLPLTFSRRHGDPSRPWNIFSIEIKDEHCKKVLNYQGNWRDIFQNWEALAFSFPGYVEGMITKFVNASTADGYNPYRITKEGFDWEVLDPHDAWSYIGYWGDHQIIYLVKLLEISARYHPGKIQDFLVKDIFTYANVPYRVKPYADLLENPCKTIDFDMTLDQEIRKRVKEMGTDGKFIANRNGKIIHVNLTEKMLVSILAKLSNYIPEAGIWMNTQRPDWNDANNALVGSGVSMVTLYYLRRYLTFCSTLFHSSTITQVQVSEEVAQFFASIAETFKSHLTSLHGAMCDKGRKCILDKLGQAGNEYRNKIYSNGFSERRKSITGAELEEFFELTLKHIDHTIAANKRRDNLYHAYNLMKVENGEGISVRHLYEMLEGQVAVLSSGYCSVRESVKLLDALRASALYRKDQSSYLLYPDRQLPRFMEKNTISKKEFDNSALLRKLLEHGNKQIVLADLRGDIHFHSDFRNADLLKSALDEFRDNGHQPLVPKEKEFILDVYERLFDHQSFTGRSGTFYKYEGLGCIYWHMVSKLLLAVSEVMHRAEKSHEPAAIKKRLADHYYEIREGIGAHKSPSLYGAFPTDPYSHTPGHVGVQQPGMSGQVKEDIISRLSELGVIVENGRLMFLPVLLRKDEFLKTSQRFDYYTIEGEKKSMNGEKGTLVFTFCQVPIVYHLSRHQKVRITKINGAVHEIQELSLDEHLSRAVFHRSGSILKIDVWITPSL
ncbi:MAG: hypothetical protein EHM64_11830 [Ignavibacteriae bacterium]|nr:MAG: hypothetical protein EHM64_11830 [Ignavibacteriota bacterium]